MSNDTELFNLCKTVYEQTGWRGTQSEYETYFNTHNELSYFGDFQAPLYTSDYLLKKLEVVGYVDGPSKGVELMMDHHNGWGWLAHIPEYYYKYGGDKWVGFSDTPLKALLKLTIALHKAGELK